MPPLFPDSPFENPDKKPRVEAGEQITLAEAAEWTKTYQRHHPGQLKAVYFSAAVFTELLKQGGDGIRIYNATNNDGQDCFVLVSATATSDLTTERLYDKGLPCPTACANSPLNHE